jgi:hypothetical protein
MKRRFGGFSGFGMMRLPEGWFGEDWVVVEYGDEVDGLRVKSDKHNDKHNDKQRSQLHTERKKERKKKGFSSPSWVRICELESPLTRACTQPFLAFDYDFELTPPPPSPSSSSSSSLHSTSHPGTPVPPECQ